MSCTNPVAATKYLQITIKIEENFLFVKLQNILFGSFFVLVKYLQLWSTVQCLRIKFTAFQNS